jgi:hypothetical protein
VSALREQSVIKVTMSAEDWHRWSLAKGKKLCLESEDSKHLYHRDCHNLNVGSPARAGIFRDNIRSSPGISNLLLNRGQEIFTWE